MARSHRPSRNLFAKVLWPRAADRDDSGMALVLVVGTMLVLSLFASAALTYSVGTLKLSRHDQDFRAALAAAQAGIDDYIRRLNANDNYWDPGYPDCTNDALKGPDQSGCLYSATKGWDYVGSSAGPTPAQFHYDVDSSTLSNSLYLTLRSTGKVNGVTRTLEASIGRGGSTDFVYYTDYEDADPANTVIYPTTPNSECINQYWWGTNGRGTTSGGNTLSNIYRCQEITFITGDVLNGPVHTNDTPLMTGTPEFDGGTKRKYSVETPDPACKTATRTNNDYYGCWRDNSSQRPQFPTRPPGPGDVLKLPDNSSQLANDPGCQFVGQTRIRFTGDGNMLVWSPETTSSNSSTTAACGGDSPAGVSVAVPTQQVIYAANNPDVAPHQCAADEIGDGLPIDGDISMQTPDQYCGQGNVYIEGTLQGRVTVGAENSIVVTGDLLLKNGDVGDDLMGLVAGNNVEVMHPWIETTTNTGVCLKEDWVETPGQWVTTSPADHGGGSLGWVEGYFTSSWGGGETWHPGYWATTSSSGYYWEGNGRRTPSSYSGSWTTAGGWRGPSAGQVWQAGTWTENSDGSFSWHQGGWVNAPSGQYWQGESWTDNGCAQYQTTTSYGESSTWPHKSDSSKIQIYASIQTLQHSFWVQNYNKGTSQGQLFVEGSIAQKYRGIVGTSGGSGTGYLKSYNYDQRLVSQSPPYFPQWQNAVWSTVRLGEVPAQSG